MAKNNISEKMHRVLRSDENEFKKNLGSANDWNTYLAPRRDGFGFDGSSPEE